MSRMFSMNRTVPANMAGKKDLNATTSSSVNIASKATATSMGGTQKTGANAMSQTAFGQTSQFKDTTARGVVSGMGLLTF